MDGQIGGSRMNGREITVLANKRSPPTHEEDRDKSDEITKATSIRHLSTDIQRLKE